MKPKEIIQLVVGIIILVVAGYLVYGQLGPKKSATASKGSTVEVITAIPSEYDKDALKGIDDPTVNRNFYTAPDFTTGIGNNDPFAPLR